MNALLNITQQDPQALAYAVQQAKQQGWDPGLDDADTMCTADTKGFFLAKLNNHIIACASAVCYDASFAFFGFYIVASAYRGQGYGWQLTQRRLQYVGDRCVGLDGVLENQSMYAKIGFKKAFISKRHEINTQSLAQQPSDPAVHIFSDADEKALFRYDRYCFPAARDNFLRAWIHAPHAQCFCYRQGDDILGYVVIRQCYHGYKIGPLFADSSSVAQALLLTALQHSNRQTVYIDVPEYNTAAQTLMDGLKTKVHFACARMYRGGQPDVDLMRIYGISSFELG